MINCPERSASLVRMPQPLPSARNRSRHWTHSCLWMCWLSHCSAHGQVPGEHSAKLILETWAIKKKVEWGWDNIPWQTYNQMLWFIFTYSGNHPGSLSQSTPHEVYSCMSLLHNQKEASRPHRHLWQTDRGDYHLYLQLVVHCHVKCEQ